MKKKKVFYLLMIIQLSLLILPIVSSEEPPAEYSDCEIYGVCIEPVTFDNNTAYVNSSEILITNQGNIDNINASQMEVNGGILNIIQTFLTGLITDFGLTQFLALDQSNFGFGDDWIYYSDPNFYFNSSKLSTTFYNATAIQVITGTPQGSLAGLKTYNNSAYNLSEDASDLELRVNFSVGVGGDFNQFIVRYKSTEEDEPHFLQVQIYKYSDSDWEDYGVIPGIGIYHTVSFPVFDADEHIGVDGVVQVRFYQDEDAPPKTHKHEFDWVTLARGFGVPSGEEVDPDFNAWLLNPVFGFNVDGSSVNSTWDNITINDYSQTGGTMDLNSVSIDFDSTSPISGMSMVMTNLAENAVALTVNSNERGIQITTVDERCIFGTSTDGVGVQGSSSGNIGIEGTSITNLAGRFTVDSATANTALNVLEVRRRTTDAGFGVNGIGGCIRYRLENDVGSTQDAALLCTVMTNVSASKEITEFRIGVRDGLNGTENVFFVKHNGTTIGGGQTGIDFELIFDGENNDAKFILMEDENILNLDTSFNITGNLTTSELGTFGSLSLLDNTGTTTRGVDWSPTSASTNYLDVGGAVRIGYNGISTIVRAIDGADDTLQLQASGIGAVQLNYNAGTGGARVFDGGTSNFLALNPGNITDSSGVISFGDEDLETTGEVGIGTTPSYPLHLVLSSNAQRGIYVDGVTNDMTDTSNQINIYSERDVDLGTGNFDSNVYGIRSWLTHKSSDANVSANFLGLWSGDFRTYNTGKRTCNTVNKKTALDNPFNLIVGDTGTYDTASTGLIEHQLYPFFLDVNYGATFSDSGGTGPGLMYANVFGTRIDMDIAPTLLSGSLVMMSKGIVIEMDSTATGYSYNYGIYLGRAQGADNNYGYYDASGVINAIVLDGDNQKIILGEDADFWTAFDGNNAQFVTTGDGAFEFKNGSGSGYGKLIAHEYAVASPSLDGYDGSNLDNLKSPDEMLINGKLDRDVLIDGLEKGVELIKDEDNCQEVLERTEWCYEEVVDGVEHEDCDDEDPRDNRYKKVEHYVTECETKPLDVTYTGGMSFANKLLISELKQENQRIKNCAKDNLKYEDYRNCVVA